MKKFLYVLVGVILIILGFLMIFYSQSTLSITFATFLFIGGATFWVNSSPESYNNVVDNMKQIYGAERITIKKMQEDFAELNTPLGKPWISKIKFVPGDAMIFGPNADGEYIYVYKRKNGKTLMIGYNYIPSFIKASKEDRWRLSPKDETQEDTERILCNMMRSSYLVEELLVIFKTYVVEGKINSFYFDKDKGNIYQFNEQFNLIGQNFILCDINGRPIYEIEGTIPLKTLRIFDVNTKELIFKLSKQIVHVLPHYDFYYKDEHYGTFEKKFDLIHDSFIMKTNDGLVEMKSVTASFGDNYRVKVAGKFIGCISENLNLSVSNIVFDNFVIYVKDKAYLPLMTALAVMAAREMARDDANE